MGSFRRLCTANGDLVCWLGIQLDLGANQSDGLLYILRLLRCLSLRGLRRGTKATKLWSPVMVLHQRYLEDCARLYVFFLLKPAMGHETLQKASCQDSGSCLSYSSRNSNPRLFEVLFPQFPWHSNLEYQRILVTTWLWARRRPICLKFLHWAPLRWLVSNNWSQGLILPLCDGLLQWSASQLWHLR